MEPVLRALLGRRIDALYLVDALVPTEEDFTGPFRLLLFFDEGWLLDVQALQPGHYLRLHLGQGTPRAQALADAREPGEWGPHPVAPDHGLGVLLGQQVTRIRLAQEPPALPVAGTSRPASRAYDVILQLFTARHRLTLDNSGVGFLSTSLGAGSSPQLERPYRWTEVE